MASIPLPVATASDAISLRVERALEPILSMCQCVTDVTEGSGKNDDMKINLTAMNTALGQWTAALTTQIAAI